MAKGKEFLTNIIIGGKVSPTLAKAINKANEQSKVLKKIGNVGKAIGKATLAASTAAAAGIVAISKSAVESYAEYEQLVGGVDTLFKESSKTIQQYADGAYKTAGLSANEYMSTVTSFSASMINSLGGDTAKAAEYANQAIIDMSDNANKMGTDIASIQQTYQSLAKGNYGMLDNLKLGYGGTKAEMQRLLKDAQKLTGIKYDITKFGDVTQAIHAIQAEMEISGRSAEEVADIYKRTGRVVEQTMGTTAREASTTIQGSFSAMKSAWTNLITGLGNEDADFDVLLDSFLDSVGTLGENLLPRISVIIGKIPDLVSGLIPLIPPVLEQLLPVAVDGVTQIITGIGGVLPELVNVVVASIGQIITGTFDKMPVPMKILAVAIAAVTAGIAAYNAVVAIKNIVDKVQEKGVKKLVAAQLAQNAAFLASPIFWIVAAVVALIAIIIVLVKNWDKVKEVAVKCWKAIKTAFAAAGQWFNNNVIQPIVGFFVGLWDKIKSIFSTVINWVKSNIVSIVLFIINPFAGVFSYLYNNCEGFRNFINNVIDAVKGFFVELWDGIKTGASNAWQGICNAFSAVGSFFSGIWATITSIFTTIGTTIGNAIGGAFKAVVNAIITFAENTINGFIRAINLAIGTINNIPGVNITKITELSIPRLATGGTFDGTKPQLSVVGDAPETMVPHGNTPRNRALLETAAKGVGVSIGNTINITFAPVISGGSGAEVREAVKESEAEFEQRMNRYFKKKGRVSFA